MTRFEQRRRVDDDADVSAVLSTSRDDVASGVGPVDDRLDSTERQHGHVVRTHVDVDMRRAGDQHRHLDNVTLTHMT